MNGPQKQMEAQKAKLLELIRTYPGMHGTDDKIPMTYRRWLRSLQVEGKAEYRDGWYAVGGHPHGPEFR